MDKREKPQYIRHTGFNVVILCAIIQGHSHTASQLTFPRNYVLTGDDRGHHAKTNNKSTGPPERQHHSPATLSECYSVESASHTLELLHARVIKLAPPFTDVSLN